MSYRIGHIIISNSLLIMSLSACSSQSWYQGAKSSNQTQCLQEPVSEYEDCVSRSDMSYHEYSRSREELLDDKQEKNKVQE